MACWLFSAPLVLPFAAYVLFEYRATRLQVLGDLPDFPLQLPVLPAPM
jgi:hypothetical protein